MAGDVAALQAAPAGDVAALQAALAGEHAAVYGYGVMGAKVGGTQRQHVRACWAEHKARRDQLQAFLTGLGVTPVGAEPAYQLPVQPTSSAAANRLAVALEDNAVTAYAALGGAADTALRAFAAQAMQAAMVWQVRWGGPGPASAFPGLDPAALRPST
jgi:hypothetical protein